MNTTRPGIKRTTLDEPGWMKAPPHTTRAVRRKASRLVRDALKTKTVQTVADLLGVGKSTAFRWGAGTLPHALYVPRILEKLAP